MDKYDLERNAQKVLEWDYLSYNDYYVISRFWKKVVAKCIRSFNSGVGNINRLVFINQLLYRTSQLQDYKQKKVFINSFFKTKYFRKDIQLESYAFKEYDIHQFCYLIREVPEVLLYTADRFQQISNFDACKFKKFFRIRYKEALKNSFHEEQLYYFYAMYLWGCQDILREMSDSVLQTGNQVLVSYYLSQGWFSAEDVDQLKVKTDEDFWFQNYHLLLYSEDLKLDLDNNIKKYLIPKRTYEYPSSVASAKERVFLDFYRENINNNKSMIRNVDEVMQEIHYYLDLRYGYEELMYYGDGTSDDYGVVGDGSDHSVVISI